MKYQAVLFDLDGTLVDSVPDIALATNAMLNELNLPEVSIEQVRTFVGKGTAVLIKRALAGNINPPDPDSDLFALAQQVFRKHYHHFNGLHSHLYATVTEGLQSLQKMGLILGVVTNKPQEFTLPLLEKMGIAYFFKVVVSGDTCALKKPHPDPIYYACQQLQIQPESALFVGDSQNDTQAANAANMDVLVLPYGYSEGISVQTLKVNAIVEDIRSVADWINR